MPQIVSKAPSKKKELFGDILVGLKYQWAPNAPDIAGQPRLSTPRPSGPVPPLGGYLPQNPFPTQHPIVENPDGSYSNVKLKGFGYTDDKGKVHEVVIPTMVGGITLTDKEAWAVAKRYGLHKYPTFDTVEEGNAWASANHARIPPPGLGARR